MTDDAGEAPGTGTAPGSGGDYASTTTHGNAAAALEALSCVLCRARKLKCCRSKPACARCVKVKAECVYPESRRKPAFKRRNVKELEQRLAQVEVLLKDAAAKTPAVSEANAARDGDGIKDGVKDGVNQPGSQPVAAPELGDTIMPDTTYLASGDGNVFPSPMSWNFNNTKPSTSDGLGMPFSLPDMSYKPRAEYADATSWELMGMGLFEALPPAEMIEELHQAYFTRQHALIPIIHPARYFQAFYSAPHLRPPMALQYAIWTMASLGHEKFSSYHDAFHRRCRNYLEEDELRGDGEHFLTVAHAQAWALVATAEARNMWFTRAAMSASRCIKLLHMMGLHRLDDPNARLEMAPTIAPPKDWIELEERRRVFWGAFAIDSHASISTGWPHLIDTDDVTTHLPSSEEAFNQGREEETCRLEEVFTGSHYSSFAGAAVICHLFNRIMKHVHHAKRDDNPQDFEYGNYWNRHRELDNVVSSAFMYLPEGFRLPKHLKDPVAVHTNLNLHASTICLHNRAYEMAIEHNLPEHVKMASKTRLETTAQEIVNIVKLTSHSNAGYRSPLVALSLYVASSVYISVVAEQGLKPADIANLEFLLLAMEAIGKQHTITRSFLGAAIGDLDRAGLTGRVRLPQITIQVQQMLPNDGTVPPACGSNIPIFARSRISKHNEIMPPLPGRLPLNNPIGIRREMRETVFQPLNPPPNDTPFPTSRPGDEENKANKRKRVRLSPEPSLSTETSNGSSTIFIHSQSRDIVEEVSSSDNTPPPPAAAAAAAARLGSHFGSNSDEMSVPLQSQQILRGGGGGTTMQYHYSLPHRAGSSTTESSPPAAGLHGGGDSTTPSNSSGVSPPSGLIAEQTVSSSGTTTLSPLVHNTTAEMFHSTSALHQNSGINLTMFQDFQSWDSTTASGNNNNNDNNRGVGLPTYTANSTQQATMHGLQTGSFATALDDENWMILNDSAMAMNGGHPSWDASMG